MRCSRVASWCSSCRVYFPEDITAIDWRGSLLDLLEKRGARPVYAVAQISALILPRELVRKHRLETKVPWLLMMQTNTTDTGTPRHLLSRLPPGRPVYV